MNQTIKKPAASLHKLDFSANSKDTADMSKEQIKDENQKLQEQLYEVQGQVQARDQVIEANHTEMVIQNMTNRQLHVSLFQKEGHRKKRNPTLNFASGRHVTSDKSWAELKRLKDEREAKEVEKKKRATIQTVKRQKKMIDEEKWDQAKGRHEVRMRRWRRVCNALDEGEALPPKPHRRLKAAVTLGARTSVPSGYMSSTSQGNGQSTKHVPTRYITSTSRIFPASFPTISLAWRMVSTFTVSQVM